MAQALFCHVMLSFFLGEGPAQAIRISAAPEPVGLQVPPLAAATCASRVAPAAAERAATRTRRDAEKVRRGRKRGQTHADKDRLKITLGRAKEMYKK